MDIQDIGSILGQFSDEENKMNALEKILAYGVQITQIKSEASATVAIEQSAAIARPNRARYDAKSNTEVKPRKSSMLDHAERNASLTVNQTKAKDKATKDMLRQALMTGMVHSNDTVAKEVAEKALEEIKLLDDKGIELIATYLPDELWRPSNPYPDLRNLILERLGEIRCIELDIKTSGFSTEVWERWALRPLVEGNNCQIENLKVAKDILVQQWSDTYPQIKDDFLESRTNWMSKICQVETRLMDILIFNTSLKKVFKEDKRAIDLLDSCYLSKHTTDPSTLKLTHPKGDYDPTEDNIQKRNELLDAFERPYVGTLAYFSRSNPDNAKSTCLFRVRRKKDWVENYMKPMLEPFKNMREAIYNHIQRDLQS